MKLTLVTVGTRGDITPFVALGCGLKKAGHVVTVASHRDFEKMIIDNGLLFKPVATNIMSTLREKSGVSWLRSGSNPIKFSRGLVRMAKPLVRRLCEDIWGASEGAEAIIYHPLALPGFIAAEKLQIPSVLATLQPLTRTASHPALVSPSNIKLGSRYNLLTHAALEQIIWLPWRREINDWRQERLGLKPFPLAGPVSLIYEQRVPMLCAYSSIISPKPIDWPAWHHITGYWTLDEKITYQPPKKLHEFLEAGDPPVYIGFGSMTVSNPRKFTEIFIEAIENLGLRAILVSGWGALQEDINSDKFLCLKEVSHNYLLPKVATAVHHGGAGTVAACLRAGIPQVIVPFFFDQGFWGNRVEELGVGPRAVTQRRLNVSSISVALKEAISEEKIMQAKKVADSVNREDGISNAVATVSKYLDENQFVRKS